MYVSDWINELLSWKAFVPLSRLTYCGYLIHIPIVQVYVWTIRTRVSYSEQQLVGMLPATTYSIITNYRNVISIRCLAYLTTRADNY